MSPASAFETIDVIYRMEEGEAGDESIYTWASIVLASVMVIC
jgi:hypothetical protein